MLWWRSRLLLPRRPGGGRGCPRYTFPSFTTTQAERCQDRQCLARTRVSSAGVTLAAADPVWAHRHEVAVPDRADRRDAARRYRRPGPRAPGAKGAGARDVRDQFRFEPALTAALSF